MTVDQMIIDASFLTVADRLRVAEAIWDSSGESDVPAPQESQLLELERRPSAYDANPSSALTPEEVESRVSNLRRKQ